MSVVYQAGIEVKRNEFILLLTTKGTRALFCIPSMASHNCATIITTSSQGAWNGNHHYSSLSDLLRVSPGRQI